MTVPRLALLCAAALLLPSCIVSTHVGSRVEAALRDGLELHAIYEIKDYALIKDEVIELQYQGKEIIYLAPFRVRAEKQQYGLLHRDYLLFGGTWTSGELATPMPSKDFYVVLKDNTVLRKEGDVYDAAPTTDCKTLAKLGIKRPAGSAPVSSSQLWYTRYLLDEGTPKGWRVLRRIPVAHLQKKLAHNKSAKWIRYYTAPSFGEAVLPRTLSVIVDVPATVVTASVSLLVATPIMIFGELLASSSSSE